MKSRYIISAFALMLSLGSYAQKDQLKALEKAIKNFEPTAVKNALSAAEGVIANATDQEKAQFYFLKGNALLELANKNIQTGNNLKNAAKSYQDLLSTEKKIGKKKYSEQAENSLTEVKNKLINSAIKDSDEKRFKESAEKLYDAYLLNPKDTINLYYAASSAVNGKEFDLAFSYYEKLKALNYSGKGVGYYAKSVINGQEEAFPTKQDRDNSVKLKVHTDPRDESIPSKRGEIFRNYALILVEKGEKEKALQAILEAKKDNPEDTSLALTEANLYLDSKDYTSYKRVIEEVLQKSPNDADLYFNLGVISGTANNPADAEKYYLKAIEINPKYSNAYLNLAIVKLDSDTKLVEEMNGLGNSAKDNKRYEELKRQREKVFSDALPYLEKVVELSPDNLDAKQTLLNVYTSLDMTDKYKALKATMN
ncbi:MAG TPA: tetratricopeptide repeat protein [Flavobacterium sp.]|uniref:tetratricopeptide repeat protein n=1 Tax=unclassified Flavobacterium TaxID=196869 RepID=UPI0025C30F8B|nr:MULTISPECIES: tetratricopeptide repeat protein [unclassified Flavobacterium]HRE78075.1 tetratricopeptide repeat protein [Flavobacterium sp.]